MNPLEDKAPFSKTNFIKSSGKNIIADHLLSIGKLPPQALDMEEAVLGALMIEKDALINVADILKPQHFYKDSHQEIYNAILVLFNDNGPVDILTVSDQLQKQGKLEFVGGAQYISKLTQRVATAANIEHHARVVIEKSIKRDIINIGGEIAKEGYDDTIDAFDLLEKASSDIFSVAENNIQKKVDNMSSLMKKAIAELEQKKQQTDDLTGVPTGFSALDRLTGGWQMSDLIIIAARPGMGKTAFVVSCMRNAAIDFNKPVALFSLEMSGIQLTNRLISAEAELNSEKLKKGTLADFEWQQLIYKTKALASAPIFIDDTPGLNGIDLRAKARRLKQRHDVQMIVIDYLQLMSGDSINKGNGNREQEIAAISRGLKKLAKELNVPVIALSQLSRAVESRGGDKRPMLSDLRESGSIEQDADIVCFLYRPEYYGFTEDEETQIPTKGVGEVIFAKHRNGSLDTIKLKFIGEYTKFVDLTDNAMLPMVGEGQQVTNTVIASSINQQSQPDTDPMKGRDGAADFDTEGDGLESQGDPGF